MLNTMRTTSQKVQARGIAPGAATVLLRVSRKLDDETIWIEVHGNESVVTRIVIDTAAGTLVKQGELQPGSSFGEKALKALDCYFANPHAGLDLPLSEPEVSVGQREAMRFLRSIPCGETRSYAQEAAAVRQSCGSRYTARNAGNANHANLFPLAIPCHRVVRSDGSLGGFMGESAGAALRLKAALLALEQRKSPH